MPGNGSAQLRAISAGCKTLGDRGLLNGARATLRVEAKPIIDAAQAEAMKRLPKSGGLNQLVASQRWTVQALAGARTAGVRLKTTAPATQQTDDGYVRHPLPRNNRTKWVRQELPQAKGWATDTVQKFGPALAAVMVRELDSAAAAVARAAGGA